MVVNFQKRFAATVENGAKRQTIRKGWRNGKVAWKPGGRLQLYTGLRTRNARLLRGAVCKKISRISIGKDRTLYYLGGLCLTPAECRELARLDGFDDHIGMALRFQANHGLPFNGGIRSISAIMIVNGHRPGSAMWKQSYGPRPAPPIFRPKYDPENSPKTAFKGRLSTASGWISDYFFRSETWTLRALKTLKNKGSIPHHPASSRRFLSFSPPYIQSHVGTAVGKCSWPEPGAAEADCHNQGNQKTLDRQTRRYQPI